MTVSLTHLFDVDPISKFKDGPPLRISFGDSDDLIERSHRDPSENSRLSEALWNGCCASRVLHSLVMVKPAETFHERWNGRSITRLGTRRRGRHHNDVMTASFIRSAENI